MGLILEAPHTAYSKVHEKNVEYYIKLWLPLRILNFDHTTLCLRSMHHLFKLWTSNVHWLVHLRGQHVHWVITSYKEHKAGLYLPEHFAVGGGKKGHSFSIHPHLVLSAWLLSFIYHIISTITNMQQDLK